MISDTLSDAASEIRRYRSNPVFNYEEVWPEMDQLLTLMDEIRIKLDTVPPELLRKPH